MSAAKQPAKKVSSRSKTAHGKSIARLPSPELPLLTFATPRHLIAWLKKNHATSPGIWMRITRKAAAEKSVTYAEALDEAEQRDEQDRELRLQQPREGGSERSPAEAHEGDDALLHERVDGRDRLRGVGPVVDDLELDGPAVGEAPTVLERLERLLTLLTDLSDRPTRGQDDPDPDRLDVRLGRRRRRIAGGGRERRRVGRGDGC